MWSFGRLLCALTLLAVTVESGWSSGSSSSSSRSCSCSSCNSGCSSCSSSCCSEHSDLNFNFEDNLSGQALTDLYNSPVYYAEKMIRPLGSNSKAVGVISHSGVRVTLANKKRWLVHKGGNFGISSQTVVTSANNMSDDWEVDRTGNFKGKKTIGDLVEAGGSEYNVIKDNCHSASNRMMKLLKNLN